MNEVAPTIDFQARAFVLDHLTRTLPGKNLYDLAEQNAVTIYKNGQLNKGWAGQTIERVAQLTGGNQQKRDGTDFELKSTSLVPEGTHWRPKETIRVTQLSPQNILEETFETSALWNKLSSLILVGCYHAAPAICTVVRVSAIDIRDPELIASLRGFWEDVRLSLCLGEFPDFPIQGTASDYIQLRGTGTGKHWSTCPITGEKFPSRAFYGTKRLIERILELSS